MCESAEVLMGLEEAPRSERQRDKLDYYSPQNICDDFC